MGKAFSEDDRVRARAVLLAEGRRLFLAGGLKAMSLSQLTSAAGIAKTSFYALFPSKEALLLDLLHQEAPGVDARVMSKLADFKMSARDALVAFLTALLHEYASNPFLARLVAEPDVLTAIRRRVRPEDIEQKAIWMQRPITSFFERRILSGEIEKLEQSVLLDLVRSVSLLSLHRDRFETPERFEAVSKHLIQFVADGLLNRENHNDH